ncbi:MAG: amino acid permease [Nocardiopsaceae bacterium]|nr:amino acid permease [Nocardiopsaceae bacterium]
MTETLPRRPRPTAEARLSTLRGAALYIGALLGPGLLLLPGLAVAEAGPASVVAWAGLLVLSALFALVFGALGRSFPSAGGVAGYVATGLGPRAGRATRWMFLTGVVTGAPVVCLIGAGYVTALTGGGQVTRAAVAAVLLLSVLALAARGLRTSTTAQLLMVALLILVVAAAVIGSAHAARAANWTPFAPHGWPAVGHAAATLMLSFVGWEAVAPLTSRFADPGRQLFRVVSIALAVTSALYLALAVATVAILGRNAGSLVPLAGLLRSAAGPAGTAGAAVAAVVLTLGATNAYINGASAMAGAPGPLFLAAISVAGLPLITLYGLGLVSPASLVAVPTAFFLAVYLGCMISALRLLRGPARWAALPAGIAAGIMLGYCGWALAAPVAVVATGVMAGPERLAGGHTIVDRDRLYARGRGARLRRHDHR